MILLSGLKGMNGGGEPDFPEARALQYSPERWWAYLPCSGWVREATPPLWPPNVESRIRTAIVPVSINFSTV